MTDAIGAGDERIERAREHLGEALDRAESEEARYHVRQALQLLEF